MFTDIERNTFDMYRKMAADDILVGKYYAEATVEDRTVLMYKTLLVSSNIALE